MLLAGCVLCYHTGLAAAFVKGFGSWVLGVLGRLWDLCIVGGVRSEVWGIVPGAGGAWLVYLGNAYRGFAVLIEQSAFRGMVCHSVFYWLLVGNGMVGRWWVTDLLRFFARYMIERRHALRRSGRTEEVYKSNQARNLTL